jgi:hypothetical protein
MMWGPSLVLSQQREIDFSGNLGQFEIMHSDAVAKTIHIDEMTNIRLKLSPNIAWETLTIAQHASYSLTLGSTNLRQFLQSRISPILFDTGVSIVHSGLNIACQQKGIPTNGTVQVSDVLQHSTTVAEMFFVVDVVVVSQAKIRHAWSGAASSASVQCNAMWIQLVQPCTNKEAYSLSRKVVRYSTRYLLLFPVFVFLVFPAENSVDRCSFTIVSDSTRRDASKEVLRSKRFIDYAKCGYLDAFCANRDSNSRQNDALHTRSH